MSTAGKAYVWRCSAEEHGRVSASLAAKVDVAGASSSHTCALESFPSMILAADACIYNPAVSA